MVFVVMVNWRRGINQMKQTKNIGWVHNFIHRMWEHAIFIYLICIFAWFKFIHSESFYRMRHKEEHAQEEHFESAYNSTAFHNYIGNTMLNSKNKVNCRTIFRSPSTQCGMFPDSIPNSWWRCFYEYRVYHKTVFTLSYVYCLVVVQTTAKKEWRQFCETPRWFVFCIMSISK